MGSGSLRSTDQGYDITRDSKRPLYNEFFISNPFYWFIHKLHHNEANRERTMKKTLVTGFDKVLDLK